ncbi:MarR family transcriptional regulator [Corallococcus sp. H22C18031201]|uniref:MarR family winged helix-turn-helix transcriptional regulator n=1 Tax=Citreicoccus inhibens TaxID=2849499 RepID=UPI000E71D154|nr:MarR family transcriptional regulator [Citreicoccus inhibens]MBU8897979.1 MarR family transcriptional regulator [Citreicoccus inhibens]RJS15818.1 MarR family transcriptional regulator [Corallococcus sp. H22C18031201]
MPVEKSEAASILTDIVLLVFRLEGGFMDAAERIAIPAGLTAASWKVLGATLEAPRTVAEIGRNMGLARQSVQRLADILVSEGQATYLDNPAHKSARLLTPTRAGRAAIDRLRDRQSRWASAVSEGLGEKALAQCRATLRGLVERTEQVEAESRESD